MKNIRSNVIVNLIRTITITLLSFISFPFAAKALGDAGMGTYTWAHTFVYYFLILAKLGIPNLAIRECSRLKNQKEAFNRKVQEFFLLQLITTIISFAFMLFFVFSLPGPFTEEKTRALIFLLSINFLVGAFSFEWVYLALEKHFYIAFRSIAVLSLSALLIILFIKYDYQIYLYAIFAISSTILTAIANIFLLKRFGVSLKPTGHYNFRPYIKEVFAIGLITFLITIYNQTDTLLLGFIDPSKSLVGSYSVGVKGIEIVITIITSLSVVFIPRATELYQKENKIFFHRLTKYSFNIALFIAIPAVIMMILLAPDIVNFMVLDENAYWSQIAIENARLSCMILAIIIFTYSLSDFIYAQVLLPMKKENYYLITLIGGVVFNLGFAFLGAYVLFADRPLLGVAIAVAGSDVLVLLTLLVLTKSYTFHALINWNSAKIVLTGGVLVLINILVLPLINLTPLLKIIVAILISGAIYISLLLLLKEDLVSSFVRKKPIEEIEE
ncbi:MAG: oligosaccharide flippase family protein [Bacilli bacterium]|nr:oligosaccharide flippase family protein [Bacilli bacterium]MDD3389014.1 oligosaccharide flippase family protein [Bacilli bacterium]MDD4520643.1 oligosaccharide flippase family protein [Bacilli bacterium]